jgi:hypothetical protein
MPAARNQKHRPVLCARFGGVAGLARWKCGGHSVTTPRGRELRTAEYVRAQPEPAVSRVQNLNSVAPIDLLVHTSVIACQSFAAQLRALLTLSSSILHLLSIKPV